MAQNNDATIAPLTKTDIENAVDGHYVESDELREAVAYMADELEEWGDEIADQEIPDGHGEFGESTVITESDNHVCIYVKHGTLGRMADENPEISDEGDTAAAVGWAHNEFAKRHGASADALGTMDAVVLPKTERVEEIISERE